MRACPLGGDGGDARSARGHGRAGRPLRPRGSAAGDAWVRHRLPRRGCERDVRTRPRPDAPRERRGAAAVVRAAAACCHGSCIPRRRPRSANGPGGSAARTLHRGTFLSNYERSKVLGNGACSRSGEAPGCRSCPVNPSSVQGPGRTGGSALLLLDIVNGRLPVLVNTWLSVVDIDGYTDAHLLAERDEAPGNRYLASGASFDVRTAVTLLRQASGRPRRVWFAPRALASVGGAVAGAMARVLRRDSRICHGGTHTAARAPFRRVARRAGTRPAVHADRGHDPARARLATQIKEPRPTADRMKSHASTRQPRRTRRNP